MYICICNDVTEDDIRESLENDELPNVGLNCCDWSFEEYLDKNPELARKYREIKRDLEC